MRIIFAFGVVLSFAAHASAVETRPAESSGLESLGRELLDDLKPEALRQPADSLHDPQPPAPRFDDLGDDIGQPSGPLSLVRVQHGMQQAESLLDPHRPAAGDTLRQVTEVQRRVVDQLDKLIEELSKQCQGGQCQPSDQPPKPSQRSQPKSGKPGTSSGRGNAAARDSTDRLGRSAAKAAADRDIEAAVKSLWGHLPERSRQQMLQSFSDEFLPKYEREIEQYYRRLSEEQPRGSAR